MKYKFDRRFLLLPNSPDGDNGGGVPPEPTNEDTTGLKTALESERKARKDFERQLKQLQESVKGIDPNKYQELLGLQKQAEEWNQKEQTIRKEEEDRWTPQLSAANQKAIDADNRYKGLLSRTIAQQAFSAANGRSGGSEDDGVTFFDAFYGNVSKHLRLNDKDQLEVVDANGGRLFSKKEPSKPMSVAEFFGSLVQHPVYSNYFNRQQPGRGGGSQPNDTRVTSQQDLGSLPRAQRLTIARQQQQ